MNHFEDGLIETTKQALEDRHKGSYISQRIIRNFTWKQKFWMRIFRIQAPLIAWGYKHIPAYRRYIDRTWDID